MHGIFLVVGPNGSIKTTTLHTALMGRMVLPTIHANDSVTAVTRLRTRACRSSCCPPPCAGCCHSG